MRKPLLLLLKSRVRWGSWTCKFCKVKIKAYNVNRHIASAKHNHTLTLAHAVQVTPSVVVQCRNEKDANYVRAIADWTKKEMERTYEILRKIGESNLRTFKHDSN